MTELIGDYCPYGQPGDRLWVRETWLRNAFDDLLYKADREGLENSGMGWQSPIHMPRTASRITLEITGVRVERVQEITPRDVVAEGVSHAPGVWGADSEYSHLIKAFAELWDKINAKRRYGWAVNPWVWVVSFRQVQP